MLAAILAGAILLLCSFVSADETQQKRTAHDRAVDSVTELVSKVLALQLRQLEVNRLETTAVYPELRRSKNRLAELVEQEMAELKRLLTGEPSSREVLHESQRLTRRILVRLLSEQARVRKRRGDLIRPNDTPPAKSLDDPKSLAAKEQQLEDLSESLEDLLEEQARAKELAERDVDAARKLEEAIAQDLQAADDDSVLDDEIESRLDQAQDAVDQAERQLQNDSASADAERLQALEAAEDALMQASVEVESQLSEVKQSLESGTPAENRASTEGVSKNQPSSGTTRDFGSGATSGVDPPVETRDLASEPWFVRLPPELQAAIRGQTRRPPPRGYEEQLREYFRSRD